MSSSLPDIKTAYPELRMPERAKLIEQLSIKCEVEFVDPASAACLWLADTECLESLIRESDDNKFAFLLRKLLDGTLGDSIAAVSLRAWAGRGRSAAAKKRKLDTGCKERDNDMCLITRAGVPVEIAHIFPYSLAQPNSAETLKDVWDTARFFWSIEKVSKWEEAVSGPNGTECCSNLMALWSSVRGLWERACFALKPLDISDDREKLKVEFFWLSVPSAYLERVELRTPPSTFCLNDHGPHNTRLWNCETLAPIRSGDVLTFTTRDPDQLPLPSVDILWMQWTLTRALALSGAGEAREDFHSDDDDEGH
ncbi:hypothetical protein AnigIFM60653_003786 [Aspergillus niger]|nr:hypothetical protein AnigIFM50267_008850 [Aspergillus niger]GLA03779.1 hypothetical protein AnigIFM60653_003786 [Aspergillus niger]